MNCVKFDQIGRSDCINDATMGSTYSAEKPLFIYPTKGRASNWMTDSRKLFELIFRYAVHPSSPLRCEDPTY